MATLLQLINTAPRWQAYYAWSEERGGPGLTTRLFRKVFEGRPADSGMLIHVSADSRYRLWLNGESIGFGPAKGTLGRYHFETYDIAPRLRRGANVLAAEVRWFGEHSPASEVHAPKPGFLVQGPEGAGLDTPGQWRVFVSPAITPDTTPYISNAHQFLGYFEHCDSRREPVGWRDADFDDSGWAPAIPLGAAAATEAEWGVAPLRTLVPRDVAGMAEHPARFWRTLVDRRVVNHRFAEPPSGWSLGRGEGGILLLESDRYATGFPEFVFSGGENREVRIMYAEALGEWINEAGRRVWQKGAVRDDFTRYEPHGYRDTLILRGGDYTLGAILLAGVSVRAD